MSEVVSLVKLGIPNFHPATEAMVKRWVDGTINNAVFAHKQLRGKIPDRGAFEKLVADGSIKKWQPLVDSGFLSQSGRNTADIIALQGSNIKDAYNKWDGKVRYLFETVNGIEAGRFKEKVRHCQNLWANQAQKKTLRMTGDKVNGLGASPIAAYWLTGELKASGLLRENTDEVLKGGPVNVVPDIMRSGFRASLVPKLTQSGILIINSDYAPKTIEHQNIVINDFIRGLQEPAYVEFQPNREPLKSYCVFVWNAPLFWLETQVVKK